MRLIRRSNDTLRRYVLGELDESPRLGVEEHLVSGPGFFDELGMTEAELAEEYLERTLSPADAERFERHYLTSRDRQGDVAFIRVLKSYAASRQGAGARARPARIRDVIRFHPVWAAAAAASIALLIGGNVWLVVGNARLQRQFDQVRAHQGREEQLRVQLQRQVAGLMAQAAPPQGPLDLHSGIGGSLPTLGLTPGRLRNAAASLPSITRAAGTSHIRLLLQLPGVDASPYRAVLYDANGRDLWMQSKLGAEVSAGQGVVAALVPAGVLSPGDYQLKLSGTARGDLEITTTYSFRVGLP